MLQSFPFRAAIFGLLILVCILLAFIPERYRAAVTLSPTDPQSLGLSGTLNQLGALNNVFGNQTAVEVALRVGNSKLVRDIVIKKAKLEQRLDGRTDLQIHRWLDDKVVVRSLRGGIILIQTTLRDGNLARDIVAAYSSAMQDRLAQISRQQTAYKRDILVRLVRESSANLAQAQSAFDNFRLKNETPSPGTAIATISQRIPQLEAAIKNKQVDLAVARQIYSDDNNAIRQIKAELGTLQRQLVQVRATTGGDQTVGRAVANSSKLFTLERELTVQRALYDSYLRFLQGTAVENLASTANIRLLEPAFIDTERQIWLPAAVAGIALFLLWGAIEFYRLRPPLGSRVGLKNA